jgi:hypothetical protein
MEFTFKVSELEFLQAAKLYRKSTVNSKLRKVLFAAFIFICLVLLFAVVMKIRNGPVENVPREQATVTAALILQQVGPLILIAALWIFLLFVWPRMRLRNIYRKSPALQGEVTVQATLDMFSVQTSTGSASRTSWSDMKTWHEDKGFILLIYPTKIYQIVSVKDLADPQRQELRGILRAALPQKK